MSETKTDAAHAEDAYKAILMRAMRGGEERIRFFPLPIPGVSRSLVGTDPILNRILAGKGI